MSKSSATVCSYSGNTAVLEFPAHSDVIRLVPQVFRVSQTILSKQFLCQCLSRQVKKSRLGRRKVAVSIVIAAGPLPEVTDFGSTGRQGLIESRTCAVG